MKMPGNTTYRNGRSIFVSTYPPQQCGIATFTQHLVTAISEQMGQGAVSVAAVTDRAVRYEFPPEVMGNFFRDSRSSYRHLAELANLSQYDVVSVQHEFGIFGGDEGAYVLDLLAMLRKPAVTTLHTVLSNPPEHYHQRLRQVVDASDAVVVLTPHATRILTDVYGVKASKVRLIRHGIPDTPFVDGAPYAKKIGAEGRFVIMTFGLLGPSKGIADMIKAMPAIVERHPEALYVIVGATHPGIVAREGEIYRNSLKQLVCELGMQNHVVFHDRYLSEEELCEYLHACSVYVTPYPHVEQISSGTLTYAVGMGKAVISTPYWYAQDLLGEGRGVLVDFHSSEALAAAVNDLIENPEKREAMRRRAFNFGRRLRWACVAEDYLRLFAELSMTRSMKVPMVTRRGNTELFGFKANSGDVQADC